MKKRVQIVSFFRLSLTLLWHRISRALFSLPKFREASSRTTLTRLFPPVIFLFFGYFLFFVCPHTIPYLGRHKSSVFSSSFPLIEVPFFLFKLSFVVLLLSRIIDLSFPVFISSLDPSYRSRHLQEPSTNPSIKSTLLPPRKPPLPGTLLFFSFADQ